VETTGSTKKAELKWDFRNVTSLEWQTKKPGRSIYSPDFHAEGDRKVKWYIQLFPNGDTEEHKGWISAFLHCRNGSDFLPSINAQFTITTAFDEERKNVWSETMKKSFGQNEPHGMGHGWCTDNLDEVLKSNFFSLVCQIEYADSDPPTKVSVQLSPSLSLTKEELTSSLSQNLEQLFNNRKETDVSFIIKGKEIKAHKAILLARSPVFAAMMESGMKESIENRIKINDITPDTFEALLRFVYTDRVDLGRLDVQDLLVAANKYMLPLLKLECQKNLSERLTTGNCAEMLALADLHNCVHLKKSAVNWIIRNRDGVMQSEGWKDLKQSRPDLAFYVFEKLL